MRFVIDGLGALVIGGLILSPFIAMFIRQAREHDRAYGPLAADDFEIPDAPAQVALREAEGPAPCSQDPRPVPASDNATSTDVAVPGHGGGVRRGGYGEVGALSGHSLAVIRSTDTGKVAPFTRWRWRCECGDKISGFDTEAEALASHAKHQAIEAHIGVMRP